MSQHTRYSITARGFTLLDVVLGIAVFAFGMLALVQLQTSLARSGADANERTVAVFHAEELVEDARSFIQLAADPDNGRVDFHEIVSYDAPRTWRFVDSGGAPWGPDYTVNVLVENQYWDVDGESFTATQPTGIVNPDFKVMDIVVMWRPLADGESLGNHDSIDLTQGGVVRLVEAIPSTPGLLGALVAADREAVGTPPVDYTPGYNPEIIRITLDEDGGKFKESTSPAPDVIRDDLIETWFDVVTYSQAAPESQAVFLRREEFVAVTCECELDTSPAEADQGLKPTLWNGVTYTEGEKVDKPIGTEVNNASQSAYCSVCCRDHHDGSGSGPEDVYVQANQGNASDHPHYARDRRGDIIEEAVGDGDEYVEACRLVRKDGFMRVTRDVSQAALLGFPEGYLDFTDGVDAYSAYVVDAVGDYYDPDILDQSDFPQPNPPDDSSGHVFPARTGGDGATDSTYLPTATYSDSQQLRARAVYTDYLTAAAQQVIDDCFPVDERTDDCRANGATSEFEIYPFFDLQMTWLARWTNASLNGLVDVTNQPIATNNTHSRGVASLTADTSEGQSRIEITSHSGNLGLTATGPITPQVDHESGSTTDSLYITANSDTTPVPPIGTVVSGSLSSAVRRVPSSDLVIASESALCGQTDTEWSCVVTGPGEITVSNYRLNNPRVYACSDMTYLREGEDLDSTTFALPASGTYDIWVTDQYNDCER